ncbi:MAG: L-serine ammonia-lyase, iron-sulfur-dependent, subunit alpha [Alphaproteobacteria bacterium]
MNITTFEELTKHCQQKNKTIFEVFQEQEAIENEVSVNEIRNKVKTHIEAMNEAIKRGLQSSEKGPSNWCGADCIKLQTSYKEKPAMFGKLFEKITTYALATSEENLRMGKIVACPTAGSCGIVPSVLVALTEEYNIDVETQINGLITAGAIGAIVSNKVQLAGAVAGCQAECGVACAMCAGMIAQIFNGDETKVLNATALALKNLLGLTCDPVCGLVEVPCIKRNSILAIHAVSASELSLAGIESKIPVDEVVDALCQTGQLMSPLLKETSLGGLAITKTALELKEKLFK